MLTLRARSIPDDRGCWIWQGATNRDGYAVMRSRDFPDQSTAHRIAFLAAGGTFQPGEEVDHTCRVRNCVNPAHLWATTHANNFLLGRRRPDMHRNGRKTECIRGHALAGKNLIIEMWRGRQMRKCKECKRLRRAGLV